MKLSRTVGYALQAVLQLAESEPGTPVPCSHLAASGHMPERFLLQILRNLVTHGVLQSTRGVEGGYRLKRAPGEISLLEVIEAADGPLRAQVPQIEGLAADTLAKLAAALGDVCGIARERLAEVKLSSLASGSTRIGPAPPHRRRRSQRVSVDG